MMLLSCGISNFKIRVWAQKYHIVAPWSGDATVSEPRNTFISCTYLATPKRELGKNWGNIFGENIFPQLYHTWENPSTQVDAESKDPRASGGDQEESNPNTWTMGSYGDNGKRKWRLLGLCWVILGLKGIYWGHMGIMEHKMETTIVYWGGCLGWFSGSRVLSFQEPAV